MAQQSVLDKFKSMESPEKWWAAKHPFIAYQAYKITKEAQAIANKMIEDPDLDNDYNGGQVDAFRHTFWMAYLSSRIGERRALGLGNAHEKTNKIQFDKKELEDGALPDAIACEMDLRNNKIGAKLGNQLRDKPVQEIINVVKEKVLSGQVWIIKKAENGLLLDWNGDLIPKKNYLGKWDTPKCLVPSNYEYITLEK